MTVSEMSTCDDCGTRLVGSYCPNCSEEIFIEQQYAEVGEGVPLVIAEAAEEQRRKRKSALKSPKEQL